MGKNADRMVERGQRLREALDTKFDAAINAGCFVAAGELLMALGEMDNENPDGEKVVYWLNEYAGSDDRYGPF